MGSDPIYPQIKEKNERSLSEVLSEVLKKSELENVQPIVEILQSEGKITPNEAIVACGKSAATIRRYFKILQKTGYVISEGSTNNVIYKVEKN